MDLKAVIATNFSEVFDLTNKYNPIAITLDVKLPDASGWRILDLFKNDINFRHIPVHLISGEENYLLAMQRGARSFLLKPLDNESINELFADILFLTKKGVKKILLIDSNFSNNSLTQKFEAKPTLEKFSVNGERNPMDKFEEYKSETSIPYVEMVGCNYGNYTPSEILPKNNLLENLRVIADHYDYVFVEGAALNTHADSKELSKYVDGIISVFSARSVLRQTDKESIQFLKHTGNKFVGAVLNEVQAENIDL